MDGFHLMLTELFLVFSTCLGHIRLTSQVGCFLKLGNAAIYSLCGYGMVYIFP